MSLLKHVFVKQHTAIANLFFCQNTRRVTSELKHLKYLLGDYNQHIESVTNKLSLQPLAKNFRNPLT